MQKPYLLFTTAGMGIHGAHGDIETFFPGAVCNNIGNVKPEVVVIDFTSNMYRKGAVAYNSNYHVSGPTAMKCLDEDDPDLDMKQQKKDQRVFPTPAQLAYQIFVEDLPETSANHVFFISDHRIENPWKKKRQLERAAAAAKYQLPYHEPITGFTDDHVLGENGKPYTSFPLEGVRIMANREHRKEFFKYLRGWVERYNWPPGRNFYFSLQGFANEPMLVIERIPVIDISFDRAKLFAEADYTCPELINHLTNDGFKHFMFIGPDSDMYMIFLLQFFKQLTAPLHTTGITLFINRGRRGQREIDEQDASDGEEDEDGKESFPKYKPAPVISYVQLPSFIDMRSIANTLAERLVSPTVFVASNIITRDNDYLKKWMFTPNMTPSVPYVFMKVISSFIENSVGRFDPFDQYHLDLLLHALYYCHAIASKDKSFRETRICSANEVRIPSFRNLGTTLLQIKETIGHPESKPMPKWMQLLANPELLDKKISDIERIRELDKKEAKERSMAEKVRKAEARLKKLIEKEEKTGVAADQELVAKTRDEIAKYSAALAKMLNVSAHDRVVKLDAAKESQEILTRADLAMLSVADVSPRAMYVVFMHMLAKRKILEVVELREIMNEAESAKPRKHLKI